MKKAVLLRICFTAAANLKKYCSYFINANIREMQKECLLDLVLHYAACHKWTFQDTFLLHLLTLCNPTQILTLL